ncbi:MAG: hypothetical protein AAF589_06080 [Planctomycetota bacterium]
MDLNRNQYFFAGILLLLIGLQLRLVSSYVLTPEVTRLLAKKPQATASASPPPLAFSAANPPAALPTSRKVVRPPDWLGWCLMSVGGVLVLHSLSMKKPE